MQGFGSVYMHSHTLDDVLDPVLQQFYSSSSTHSSSVLKVPVRSNFRKFIFLDFSKVYVAVTYPAKPFFDPSTGSPFFPTVFLVILRPPLIGHVPTAQ